MKTVKDGYKYLMARHLCFLICISIFFFLQPKAFAQKINGSISGTVYQNENVALPFATIQLCPLSIPQKCLTVSADKEGFFHFDSLTSKYYFLKVSAAGFTTKTIDSIQLKEEKMDVDLKEIIISNKNNVEEEVIVYAERPLVENKDGKIIFNVGETAAANSSNVNELLQKTPLVTIDANGTILLKGKEVKILIDDKPVELNAKQLQEMLESMPGSFIDKIEVMTNPPPQYANERGGVINIVSKKGKVGFTLRANLYYGTRGESGSGFATTYRKNKISTQLNISVSDNKFIGNSYYTRQNNYSDSSNYLNAQTNYVNKSFRPSLRWNTDYDINKRNSINFSLNLNANIGDNNSETDFANSNRNLIQYKFNDRVIASDINNQTMNLSSNYLWKDKKRTGVIKIITGFVYSKNENQRNFYLEFFGMGKLPLGIDSTQFQKNFSRGTNYSLRVNYDKSLDSGRYFFSTGINYFDNNNYNNLDAAFLKKTTNVFVPQTGFENEFYFRQQLTQARVALKYRFKADFYGTVGLQAENTGQGFDHISLNNRFKKTYFSFLPSALITIKSVTNYTFTLSYRKTLQRPGINETNPALDIADPYNTRFGNPYLLPYYAHNFDFSISKNYKKLNYNTSIGYNSLLNLYVPIRTLQTDGKTFITYQNISNRKEYEASIWGGYTLSKNSKISGSVGYNYNVYSDFDKKVLRYRNGGNLTSNINSVYNFKDLMQYGAAVTYNRFANPQGTVRSNVSMNLNVQRKFFRKTIIVTVSAVDPFTTQQNTSFTHGSNFILQNYSFTKTRNFKLNLAYNFIKRKPVKKKIGKK